MGSGSGIPAPRTVCVDAISNWAVVVGGAIPVMNYVVDPVLGERTIIRCPVAQVPANVKASAAVAGSALGPMFVVDAEAGSIDR